MDFKSKIRTLIQKNPALVAWHTLLLVFFISNFLIGLKYSSWDWNVWFKNLRHLDSGWYLHNAINGYITPGGMKENQQYAFLPFWSLILDFFYLFTPRAYLHVTGTAISTLLFFISLYSLRFGDRGTPIASKQNSTQLLYANSSLALLPLVFAPGAWVYFSNHTESAFLLFSVLAFQFAYKDKLVLSSIMAGLAALTRNQGILVAVCIGLVFFLNTSKGTARIGRNKKFLVSGLISGAIYSCWLGFMYLKTGSIFTSLDAQKHWSIISTFQKYLNNFLFLNKDNIYRAFWFWSMLITAIVLILKKNQQNFLTKPIGLYIVSSLLLWPIQGKYFHQAFRFGAVIFPFWLIIGHKLDFLFHSSNLVKRFFSVSVFCAFIFISLKIAGFYYNRNYWPY